MPNAVIHSSPQTLRVKTGLPHEFLNAILRADISDPDPEPAIVSAIDEFRSDRVPITWWVGPSTTPPDLGKHLQNWGFEKTGDLSGMAISLDTFLLSPALPRELSIEPVRDVETLETWMEPFAFGYEMPKAAARGLFDFLRGLGFGPDAPFRHFLGRWKGEPVATTSLFFGAGVAGIYITVKPEFRGQGIGSGMTLVPVRTARAAGYRVAITHVPEYRYGFHRKLGFKPYCQLGTYVMRDPGSTGKGP
jgi:GNAT superfamily N-acetyltransferase